jgi:hypothetical protein
MGVELSVLLSEQHSTKEKTFNGRECMEDLAINVRVLLKCRNGV